MADLNNIKFKILVAPLDWGLGHTTRCMPIIYELISNKVEVLLAGNTTQQAILSQEFPDCKFLPLEGYNVTYSQFQNGFAWQIARQIPKIAKAIKNENNWLKRIIAQEQINGVISDNRFGLFSKNISSVFITHQLHIKTTMGKSADALLQAFNYKKIKNFNLCWVPDFKEVKNLGGELSHPEKMPPIQCEYIGPLTRMKAQRPTPIKDHLLIVLSGPEPQRSIFEKLITEQLQTYKGTAVFVRGLPNAKEHISNLPGVSVFNHLNKDRLQEEMLKAAFIICRSGYSSVMDINALCAKSILVPTPGQTEQEYLAAQLMKKGLAVSCHQKDFDLLKMLEKASSFNYSGFIKTNNSLLQNAVKNFVANCYAAKS